MFFIKNSHARWRAGQFHSTLPSKSGVFLYEILYVHEPLALNNVQIGHKLTLHVFGDGLRQGLNAAGKVPGVLLHVETQPFGAVHLGLHLQQEL